MADTTKNKTAEKVIMRKMSAVVVKKSADQTVKVRVARMVVHPKYGKRYLTHKQYLAHDPKNECEVGQKVVVQQCRPISKMKTWRVVYKK